MFAPKIILVPTDFSSFSDEALERAYDIAKEYNATIYLLHVIVLTKQCVDYYCLDDATIQTIETKSGEASKNLMEKQIARVIKSKDVEVVSEIAHGIPYEEILKEQKKRSADLVVIASHGMSGLAEHFMIGSIAANVSKGAKCPVLLI
jgi:nucleotide-binding universal stress UspA family protein